MFSFEYPQMILATYLALAVIFAPIIRMIMIRRGAKGFVPWRDFWGTWFGDVIGKSILVAILFWGGFWG